LEVFRFYVVRQLAGPACEEFLLAAAFDFEQVVGIAFFARNRPAGLAEHGFEAWGAAVFL
jgi:hypothetical protein